MHKKTVTATVRVPGDGGGRRQETATFKTTVTQLTALAVWLAGFGVTLVGMESTGVYWVESTGRRNTSRWRWSGMYKHERVAAVRQMRGKMWSPGRPSTARREHRVGFWNAIARG